MENILDFDAILPGGGACYPAIWIQDFTMIFFGGAVSLADGLAHLLVPQLPK